MEFDLTLVLVRSNRAVSPSCGPAKQRFGLLVISQNKYQWKQTYIFSKWKCQFSPAVDFDDFNQLKEAKQAFVGDKLCEVIALCEAA